MPNEAIGNMRPCHHRPAVDPGHVEAILRRVKDWQQAVGYTGTYREWMQRHGVAEA